MGSFGDTGVPCVTTAGSADSTPPPDAREGVNAGGDVVKETLKQQRYLIQQLESYIRGAYTGGLR